MKTPGSQSNHPLDQATERLYTLLEKLGIEEVRDLYGEQKWAQLGQSDFGRSLGSIEATKSFFLTAVELWIAETEARNERNAARRET